MSSIMNRRESLRKGTTADRRRKRLRKRLKAQEPRRMPHLKK